MNSLFIDTSGWASLFISTQPYYHQAEQYFRLSLKQQKKLYTTNYILAELVALLNSPLGFPVLVYLKLLMLLKW
jgi:predicted nucleic acid-binding protein